MCRFQSSMELQSTILGDISLCYCWSIKKCKVVVDNENKPDSTKE